MRMSAFQRMGFFVLLLLLVPAAGCGTVQSAYKTMYHSVANIAKPDRSGLKKRLVLLPFLDQAGLGENKVTQMTATFLSLINKDGTLLVARAADPMPSSAKIRSPEFGIVIDPDMAKRAEEMGMNVLITVVLSPFEIQTVRKGIWPFRGPKREVQISMVVNALDVTNSTLFLTNLESRKIILPEEIMEGEEEEEERFDVKDIDEKALNKVWSQIIESQVSVLAKALRDQPWSGRVLSSDGKTIILSAGRDVGLTQGKVLEVYGHGETIRSAGGRSLNLLGPKVGEVKTVEVEEDHSSAVPVSGSQFRAGQVIRPKD